MRELNMRTMKKLLVGFVVLAGCTSSADVLSTDPAEAAVVSEVGQTFDLKVGQTARIGNGGLLVGFRGVAADSRCAIDVQCVWAGDAEARIPVTVGRMAWTSLALHTGVDPRSMRFNNYTISVVALKPEPRSNRKIGAEDYVVTLRVE